MNLNIPIDDSWGNNYVKKFFENFNIPFIDNWQNRTDSRKYRFLNFFTNEWVAADTILFHRQSRSFGCENGHDDRINCKQTNCHALGKKHSCNRKKMNIWVKKSLIRGKYRFSSKYVEAIKLEILKEQIVSENSMLKILYHKSRGNLNSEIKLKFYEDFNLHEEEITLFFTSEKVLKSIEIVKKKNDEIRNDLIEKNVERNILKLNESENKNIPLFTKEEDLFIIEHSYYDKTFQQITTELKKKENAVIQRLRMSFGSPSPCESHLRFLKSCKMCQISRIQWKQMCKEKINSTKYPKVKSGSHFNKDEDKFIDHADENISFSEIDSDLKRRTNSSNSISSQNIILNSKKIKSIISASKKYKKILPSNIYDDIVDFIARSDNLLKGRSIKVVFQQSIRVFLSNYFNLSDFSEYVPFDLLDLFFKINPNNKILKHVIIEFRNKYNSDFKNIRPNLLYTLKDLKNLTNFYSKKICTTLFHKIYKFYNDIPLKYQKAGNLGAIYYLYNRFDPRRSVTQAKVAQSFEVTEVTLRSRVKPFLSVGILKKYLDIFHQEFKKYETNQEVSIEKSKKFDRFNQSCKNLIDDVDHFKIIELIGSLKIQNITELMKVKNSIMDLTRLGDSNIIMSLIDNLISGNCCDEELFAGIVRYMGSEDDVMLKEVLKFIYHFRPELKDLDIYSILDQFSNSVCMHILQFIEKKEEREIKRKYLRNYIENKIYEDMEPDL